MIENSVFSVPERDWREALARSSRDAGGLPRSWRLPAPRIPLGDRQIIRAIGSGERTHKGVLGKSGIPQTPLDAGLKALVEEKRAVVKHRPYSDEQRRKIPNYYIADPYLAFSGCSSLKELSRLWNGAARTSSSRPSREAGSTIRDGRSSRRRTTLSPPTLSQPSSSPRRSRPAVSPSRSCCYGTVLRRISSRCRTSRTASRSFPPNVSGRSSASSTAPAPGPS